MQTTASPLFKALLKGALAASVLLGALGAAAQNGKTEVLWLG